MNGCSLEKNCNEALGKTIRQNDVRNDQGFLSSIFQLAIAQSCGYAVTITYSNVPASQQD